MINPTTSLATPKHKPAFLVSLALFITLAFGFNTLLSQLEETVRQNIQANLVTIGELKIDQIQDWLMEARKDTEFLLTRPSVIDPLDRWLVTAGMGQPFDPDVAVRLEDFRKHRDFKALVLLSTEGQPLMGERPGLVESAPANLARRVVQENQWHLIDFYRHPNGQIELGLIIPVRSRHRDQVIATLLVIIDPMRFLYPRIQSWPVRSISGETLLVKADGAHVTYLNPLRFSPDAALTLTFPTSDPDLPAAKAARGEYGVAEGVDYRGKQVLSYAAPIPETPWSIVTKLDLDEAYRPLKYLSQLAAGVLGVFLSLLLGLIWLFWRDRRSQYESALLRQQIAAELSEEKFKAIFDHSADGILVARIRDKKFILSNPAICRMLGYTSSELVRMGVEDIHPREALPEIMQKFEQFALGEIDLVANMPLLRKDGSVLFADVNAGQINVEGDPCQIGLFRDMTERKQNEEVLRDSDERFRLFLNHNPIIAWLVDERGRYVYFNQTYEERFGVRNSHCQGKTMFEVWPEGMALKLSAMDQAILGTWESVEQIDHAQDCEGKSAFWMTFKFPFRNARGEKFVGGVGVDVTSSIEAKKAIEQLNTALRDSSMRLQREISAERKRIAHALHDEIGQNLTALSLYLHRLTKRVESDEVGAQIAGKMEEAVVALGDSIRRTLTDLRPVLLEQVGLNLAIRTLVREFETAHEIAVDLTLDGEFGEVSPHAAQVIYRFLQECLTNIAKHASASEVQVVFRHTGDAVTLEVCDNGDGFAIGPPSCSILGMQDRASAAGGQLTVESVPGKGTRLTLSLSAKAA